MRKNTVSGLSKLYRGYCIRIGPIWGILRYCYNRAGEAGIRISSTGRRGFRLRLGPWFQMASSNSASSNGSRVSNESMVSSGAPCCFLHHWCKIRALWFQMGSDIGVSNGSI